MSLSCGLRKEDVVKKDNALKKDWFRLSGVFIEFCNSGCKVERMRRPKRYGGKGSPCENAWNEFSEEGEGVINFRFFQIGIRQADKPGYPNMDNVRPLQSTYLFLRFTRYKENAELLDEIRKLGKKSRINLSEVVKNTFMLLQGNR